MPREWEKYFELSDDIPPEKRAIIEDMLDYEFSSQNPNKYLATELSSKIEGDMFNNKAFVKQFNNSLKEDESSEEYPKSKNKNKILITTNSGGFGSSALSNTLNSENDYKNRINLDFDQTSCMGYIDFETGNITKATLNSVFRHELKHIADGLDMQTDFFNELKTLTHTSDMSLAIKRTVTVQDKHSELKNDMENSPDGKDCIKANKKLDRYEKKHKELIDGFDQLNYADEYLSYNKEESAVEFENSFFTQKELYGAETYDRDSYVLALTNVNADPDLQYLGLKSKNFNPSSLGKVTYDDINNKIADAVATEKAEGLDVSHKKWLSELQQADERFQDLGIYKNPKRETNINGLNITEKNIDEAPATKDTDHYSAMYEMVKSAGINGEFSNDELEQIVRTGKSMTELSVSLKSDNCNTEITLKETGGQNRWAHFKVKDPAANKDKEIK